MDRSRCIAMRPGVIEGLEPRWLLSAAHGTGRGRAPTIIVPGNTGTIRHSQFLSGITRSAAGEEWGLTLHGPIAVRVVTPYQGQGMSGDLLSAASDAQPGPPVSTGLIAGSQFAAGGFLQFGAQFRRIRLGRGLTIDSYDEASGQPGAGGRPRPNVASPASTGAVIGTQFNDGGFGDMGLQWRGVHARGGLEIRYRSLLRNPDGSPLPASTGGPSGSSVVGPPVPIEKDANSNLLLNSQFNDGGFGKVGLQWHDVRVRGPVALGSQKFLIQPLPAGVDAAPPVPAGAGDQTQLIYGSPTNTGWIRDSQFNDGGFGDVGYQWWNVAVGGRVAVSTNNLTIQPLRDGVGPITVDGLDYARGLPAPPAPDVGTASSSSSVQDSLVASPAGSIAVPMAAPAKNEATNSGRIVRTQFADGGFGDVGLQWLAVKVDGSVTDAHSSLSVQPENIGQGQIAVSNIHFPSAPGPVTPLARGPRRVLPPAPAPIGHAGGRPPRLVTPPTRPGFGDSVKNEATNSGALGHSQVADGGFGDLGLQWHLVHVMGNVRVVHNSLSVQPEKSALEGVVISNVSYGNPFTPPPSSRHGVGFAVLPSLVSTPPPQPKQEGGGSNNNNHNNGGNNGSPPNNRVLDHQQILTSTQADVVLQWDGVHLRRGLVIVHNVIEIQSAGPTTGPVILRDIRFPGRIPPINATKPGTNASPAAARVVAGDTAMALGTAASPAAIKPRVINAATNSGALEQNQFIAGGFGDIGLQWRGVKVHGSVTLVHNTLSVNAAATATGPITISNVTFNSGAFDRAARSVRHPRLIIAPPPKISRRPRFRPIHGRILHQNPRVANQSVNSGILAGGQYASGGLGHIGIQWRKVGISGPVTIIDNVLSIKTSGPATSPVTVEHVTFG